MAVIEWLKEGEKLYETGVDRGVLYVYGAEGYGKGVPWNGLTSVDEKPTGAEATALYADNILYQNLISAEKFTASISAYTYPPEFEACDGAAELVEGLTVGQQTRAKFGFTYRTLVGNDTMGEAYGYKIHIVYGCQASPSSKTYNTVNDSPDAITFSWEINTTPVNVTGAKPTATVVIDSTKLTPAQLKAVEDLLYGTLSEEPKLPMPDELKQAINTNK